MTPRPLILFASLLCLAWSGCDTGNKADESDGDGTANNGTDTGSCNTEEALVGYRDADGDGYGWGGDRITPCSQLPAGYVDNDDDCDDNPENGALIYPGAEEFCDGLDNDCDFQFDEDPIDASTYYKDADSDGFGDSEDTIQACNLPDGYTLWPGDCNPENPLIFPGAKEICDGEDNDCNDVIDDGDYDPADEDEDMTPWYADTDGDGHGDGESIVYACLAPEGYTGSPSDCDDDNADIHILAPELCDGIDNNCNDLIDEVADCEDTGSP